MNLNAKQINHLDVTRMDITTVLGFFLQVKDVISANTALATALDTVWTTYTAALDDYDGVYAQSRKWLQTDELKALDKDRDTALRALLNAIKAMTQAPNAEKAAAAKRVQFVCDKYTIDAGDEYMKETTAVSQMVHDMETACAADIALLGLDEWLADLKAKNQAFLVKMNERTAEQAGLQKGIVRDKRVVVEAAYRNVVKLINAMAIVEVPAGLDFGAPIDRLNAEVEHYRQILARKGISTGSGEGGEGSGDSSDSGAAGEGGDSGGSSDSSGSSGSSDSSSSSNSSSSSSSSSSSDSSSSGGSGSGGSSGGSGDSGSGGSDSGGSNDDAGDGME